MIHQPETISLPVADVLRQASSQTLAQELLARLSNGHPAPASSADLPPIGTERNGEIYAGLSIADNQPVALWLLPGDEKLNWKDAVARAEKQGGVLPSRIDQLVLLKNLKQHFKEDWYWSGETHPSDAGSAWGQIFTDGCQDFYRKDYYFRARAVRRSVIQ